MKLIESKESLQTWEEFQECLKLQLKQLAGAGAFYVSKEKIPFSIAGKAWNGHALLAGPKAILSVQKLLKQGVVFREGTCTKAGKDLTVGGLDAKYVKGAARTLAKLRLGYKITGVEDGEDEDGDDAEDPAAAPRAAASAAPSDELAGRAQRIAKAVQVWTQTEAVATKEVRKLQQALRALDDPRTEPIATGLEAVLTRIDRVDDEARAVQAAAQAGDAAAFTKARSDFVAKLQAILAHVENDELIRLADSNPLTTVKIRETYTRSLRQLVQAV